MNYVPTFGNSKMTSKVDFECMYCGNKWVEVLWSVPRIARCQICKDRNIKINEQTNTKNAFGYDDEMLQFTLGSD